MRNCFAVRLHSYSGCSPVPETCEDRKEARRAAARILRRARRAGNPVVRIIGGAEWEIQEPDGAATVSDDTGSLEIVPPVSTECFECGCDFEPEEVPEDGTGGPRAPRRRSLTCPGCIETERDFTGDDETDDDDEW